MQLLPNNEISQFVNLLDRDGAAPAPSGVRHSQANEEKPDRDLHFIQLMNILRRRSGLILFVVVIGTLSAGVLGWLLPRKYTATAQIMVDPQQADAAGNPGPDAAAIDTQVAMLSSRHHIQRVLDSLARERGSSTAASKTGTRSDDSRPPEAAWKIGDFERRLNVVQIRQSRVISISFAASTPEAAAAIANRIADLHIASTADDKRRQIDEQLTQLDTRAAQLKAELTANSEIQQRALEHPLAGVDAERLNGLKREISADGQAYADVLRRQKEFREQQERITPEAHVLSRAASPDRPSSPNPILFIFPALIASAVCGSLLAIARERLDRGLRSERDVTEALGIPCIGLVPRVPGASARYPHKSLVNRPFAPYTEAIRSSAAALQIAATEHLPKTVLISSSVPGEGKTTLAVSMAVYAAHLGRRTLLIDADFRHPSALRRKHAKNDTPVPDLQQCSADALVLRIPELNIDYLPIPRSSTDPLTFFGSAHLQNFLRELRGRYDCVFIDSAPLLGITEARLLRTVADKILFIIKWDSTRREVAQNALNLLRQPLEPHDGRLGETSAIITQVDLKRHANYGYGDAAETFVKFKKYYFDSATN